MAASAAAMREEAQTWPSDICTTANAVSDRRHAARWGVGCSLLVTACCAVRRVCVRACVGVSYVVG